MRSYINDDYAGLDCGDIEFYYGYEVTKGDDWCFRAKKGSELLAQWTAAEMGVNPRDSMETVPCLLAGIGKMVDDGLLVVQARNSNAIEACQRFVSEKCMACECGISDDTIKAIETAANG